MPMVAPRFSGGVHSAIALMFPGQPEDWARPLTIMATKKNVPAAEAPKAKHATAESNIP